VRIAPRGKQKLKMLKEGLLKKKKLKERSKEFAEEGKS